MDRGWRYDAEVWFFDTFLVGGRIRELRRQVLEMAGWGSDQSLLDVGCGTGTLAIQAARAGEGSARVVAIDPAPRQIARARSKARRAGVEVDFRAGAIESMPFPDESFGVVTSTLMLHHLPDELKARGLAEVRRVLTDDGRLIVAEFLSSERKAGEQSAIGDARDQPEDPLALVERSGFVVEETRSIEFPRQHRGWSGAAILRARKT